jgi:hypothetical protein
VKKEREVKLVELPLPMPADPDQVEPSTVASLADESDDADRYTPEALEATLDAAFHRVQAEQQIIDVRTGIEVDGRSLSFTELLLGNDFDIDHVKFSPSWAADEVQVTHAPSRMGTAGGFNVDNLMAMADLGQL